MTVQVDRLLYDFKVKGDHRGSLIALQSGIEVPFDIKRVYYIFDTLPDVRRGFHAHKELVQVLVCVSGSCKVMLDDGTSIIDVELNAPTRGLLVDKRVWHEMYEFSSDCVLMVLASDYYTEEDYIRDYNEFKRYIIDGLL